MLTREKHVSKALRVFFAKNDYDACLHVPKPPGYNQIAPLTLSAKQASIQMLSDCIRTWMKNRILASHIKGAHNRDH